MHGIFPRRVLYFITFLFYVTNAEGTDVARELADIRAEICLRCMPSWDDGSSILLFPFDDHADGV